MIKIRLLNLCGLDIIKCNTLYMKHVVARGNDEHTEPHTRCTYRGKAARIHTVVFLYAVENT